MLVAALFRSGVPSSPPHDRVAVAVLLADPEYNPADPRTPGSIFEPSLRGSLRRPAFPAPLNGRVRSYRRRHDIVCQRDDPAASKDTAVNCELRGQETLAFRCGRSSDTNTGDFSPNQTALGHVRGHLPAGTPDG